MSRVQLILRKVEDGDCRMLWEWANDPVTRANSFTTDPIPWESHQEWFRKKRQSPDTLFFIGMEKDQPIGQVRFDLDGSSAVISISIASGHRGKGLGERLIRAGSEKAFEEVSRLSVIHAWVEETNLASIRAFGKAGYTRARVDSPKGELYELRRESYGR